MPSFIVLVPPVLVLVIAITSRNVILSLLTGILSAAAISTNFSVITTIKLAICRVYTELQIQNLWCGESPDHLYTFGFLIFLGIIISLITHMGGISAYTRIIQKKLHNKKNTETTSLLLSTCFFMDDYLSNLTVGSIMRPLTDKFKIPRVKLAFLLDAMTSPLCIIVPATSWVAMVLTNLQASGVSESSKADIIADPFNAYLHAIPYCFYPIFIIICTWVIVRYPISFGSMRVQELEAKHTGNLFGNKEPLELKLAKNPHDGYISDFIIPISTFLVSVIVSVLYSGQWKLLGGNKSFLIAIQEANTFYALFLASIITLLISIILFINRKHTLKEFKEVVISGTMLMKNSILVLLFAWTFSSLLKYDLKTGEYLGQLLSSTLPVFTVPLMIFFTSGAISASTGSVWGTVSVMMPLAIPLVIAYTGQITPIALESATLLFPVLGALLSGALAGSHVSPISDATIMASTGAGAYHLDHVITQMGYIIPVIIGTITALILNGALASYPEIIKLPASFIIGLGISITILILKNKKAKNL